MFTIDKFNKIKLTRGDTATMYVEIFDLDNKPYTIKDTDVITFTLRKTADSAVSLTKTATASHHIVIGSSDTANLNTGMYVYDVQLTTNDGYIYTIIPTCYFQLTSEVTHA